MFKLYILNQSEAFFGFYPITEHAVTLHGQAVPMYDLMGKDATMFHYEQGDDPTRSAASSSPRPRPGSTACGPPSAATAANDRPPLQQILSGARHLLLDFDGPVCSVFAGTPASRQSPTQATASTGVMGYTAARRPNRVRPAEVFRESPRSPRHAADRPAAPDHPRSPGVPPPGRAPGSADLMITACRTGRTVTIVSNNSGAAIAAYLDATGSTAVSRASTRGMIDDPERMKPDPYQVREAVTVLSAGTQAVRPGRRLPRPT